VVDMFDQLIMGSYKTQNEMEQNGISWDRPSFKPSFAILHIKNCLLHLHVPLLHLIVTSQ